MTKIAGNLLWNRMQITLVPGPNPPIATGLTQTNLAFGTDPPLNGVNYLVASRVQVVPLAPTAAWANVTHGEPYVGIDGTVYVAFTNADVELPTTINVLFWDPHSMIGPGDADTYLAPL